MVHYHNFGLTISSKVVSLKSLAIIGEISFDSLYITAAAYVAFFELVIKCFNR